MELVETSAKDPEADDEDGEYKHTLKVLWKPRTKIAVLDIGLFKFDVGSDFYTIMSSSSIPH